MRQDSVFEYINVSFNIILILQYTLLIQNIMTEKVNLTKNSHYWPLFRYYTHSSGNFMLIQNMITKMVDFNFLLNFSSKVSSYNLFLESYYRIAVKYICQRLLTVVRICLTGLGIVVTISNILAILFISIDRLIFITRPFGYHSLMNGKITSFMITFTWAYSLFTNVAIFATGTPPDTTKLVLLFLYHYCHQLFRWIN